MEKLEFRPVSGVSVDWMNSRRLQTSLIWNNHRDGGSLVTHWRKAWIECHFFPRFIAMSMMNDHVAVVRLEYTVVEKNYKFYLRLSSSSFSSVVRKNSACLKLNTFLHSSTEYLWTPDGGNYVNFMISMKIFGIDISIAITLIMRFLTDMIFFFKKCWELLILKKYVFQGLDYLQMTFQIHFHTRISVLTCTYMYCSLIEMLILRQFWEPLTMKIRINRHLRRKYFVCMYWYVSIKVPLTIIFEQISTTKIILGDTHFRW